MLHSHGLAAEKLEKQQTTSHMDAAANERMRGTGGSNGPARLSAVTGMV